MGDFPCFIDTLQNVGIERLKKSFVIYFSKIVRVGKIGACLRVQILALSTEFYGMQVIIRAVQFSFP